MRSRRSAEHIRAWSQTDWEPVIVDLYKRLEAVLERLPVAVALVSRSGELIGKTGGISGLLGKMAPSFDAREAGRWSFADARGSAIPRADWPSGRALRGERHYAGMIGKFLDGEVRKIKVTSMPTFDPKDEIAAITFVQAFDNRSRSADGSHHDLQERLIDELVKAVGR